MDEHTAALIDPGADLVQVVGRGAVTVRRNGHSTVLPTGTTPTLSELQGLTRHGTIARMIPRQTTRPAAAAPALTVSEVAADCEHRFDAAVAARDAETMAQCLLDLEECMHDWSSDTEQDDGAQQARAVLRTLIVRLGQAAVDGLIDPVERLRPVVQPLVELRAQLRHRGDFTSADAVRAVLTAAGVELRDDVDGAQWLLR